MDGTAADDKGGGPFAGNNNFPHCCRLTCFYLCGAGPGRDAQELVKVSPLISGGAGGLDVCCHSGTSPPSLCQWRSW